MMLFLTRATRPIARYFFAGAPPAARMAACAFGDEASALWILHAR